MLIVKVCHCKEYEHFSEESKRIWEEQCSGTHWLLDDLDSVDSFIRHQSSFQLSPESSDPQVMNDAPRRHHHRNLWWKRNHVEQNLRDISSVYRRLVWYLHRTNQLVNRIQAMNSTQMVHDINFSINSLRKSTRLTRDSIHQLNTHTKNLYINAMYCRRQQRLGLTPRTGACRVLILDRIQVRRTMIINFDHRKTSEEYHTAQKLLDKCKRQIRIYDQQAVKIKLTQAEHTKSIQGFRNKVTEHRYKLRATNKATETAHGIMHSLNHKLHTTQFVTTALRNRTKGMILKRREGFDEHVTGETTADRVRVARRFLADAAYHNQNIDSRKRHLSHSPRIVQRKTHQKKSAIMDMLQHWLNAKRHSRIILTRAAGKVALINSTLLKAKPYYNYLKALEEITRRVNETNLALNSSHKTQQETFQAICPSDPETTPLPTRQPVTQAPRPTMSARTTPLSTTAWKSGTTAFLQGRETGFTFEQKTTETQRSITVPLMTTPSTTTTTEYSWWKPVTKSTLVVPLTTKLFTTTTPSWTTTTEYSWWKPVTKSTSVVPLTTKPFTTTTPSWTTTTEYNLWPVDETTLSEVAETTTPFSFDVTTTSADISELGSGDDSAEEEEEKEDTWWGGGWPNDQPDDDDRAPQFDKNSDSKKKARSKRSASAQCVGLSAPHQSSAVLANDLKERWTNVNRTHKEAKVVEQLCKDLRERLVVTHTQHGMLRRHLDTIEPVKLEMRVTARAHYASPRRHDKHRSLTTGHNDFRRLDTNKQNNKHSHSGTERSSRMRRRRHRRTSLQLMSDERSRNNVRGRHRTQRTTRSNPRLLQIDPRFDSVMKTKNRKIRRAKFQAKKALKKALFVADNVNYLVGRVNETASQLHDLQEEIANLPPSKEVAEVQAVQREVRHLDYTLYNTHARMRTISETIRHSIQDIRLKIQHTQAYYQWVQPILPVGRRDVVREVPRRVQQPSLVNNMDISVNTNSPSGTIVNLVHEDRHTTDYRDRNPNTTPVPSHWHQPTRVPPPSGSVTPQSVSVGVEQGRACLIWTEHGESRKICGPRISNGQWHQLSVRRHGNSLQLMVDERRGRRQRSVRLPFSSTVSTLPNTIVFPRHASSRSKRDASGSRFNACVTNVMLDGVLLDLSDHSGFHAKKILPSCADAQSMSNLLVQRSRLQNTAPVLAPGPFSVNSQGSVRQLSFAYKSQDWNCTLFLFKTNRDFLLLRIYNGKIGVEGMVKGLRILRFCYDFHTASDGQWHHVTMRTHGYATELYLEHVLCEVLPVSLFADANEASIIVQPSNQHFSLVNDLLPSKQPLKTFHGTMKHLMINNRLVFDHRPKPSGRP